jgi:CHAT domain-containing protein
VRANLHVSAHFALLDGQPAVAAARMEKLLRDDPANAQYWSDLAASRYEDSVRRDDAEMTVGALAAADRALEIAPIHHAALFNRALSLEALGVRADAVSAFELYVRVDPASEWAAEARRRITANRVRTDHERWDQAMVVLERAAARGEVHEVNRIVAAFPQQARTWAEGEFLARWGDAFVKHRRTEESRWLGLTHAIADALGRRHEMLLGSVVAAIGNANPAQRAQLANAHLLYRTGRQRYARGDLQGAITDLGEAEHLFIAARSPMGHVAAYYRANALYDNQQTRPAALISEQLAREVPAQHRALRAQIYWLRGLIDSHSDRLHDALRDYQLSLTEFSKLGELENAGRVRGLYASILAQLGEDTEAWRQRRSALREASLHGRPWLTEVTLNDAARHAVRRANWDVARSLLRVQLGHRTTNPRIRVDALTKLAFAEAASSGRRPDLGRVRVALTRVKAKVLREDAADEVEFVEALYGGIGAEKSLAVLEDVISYRQRTRRTTMLVAALLARAQLQMSLGREEAAARDLERAVLTTENRGEHIRQEDLRDAYFDAASDAYEQLAHLHCRRRRPAQAFEVADRSRARLIATGPASPADAITSIQRRLDDDTVLVQFTAFSDRLLVVAIERNRWTSYSVAVSRAILIDHRDRFLSAIRRDDALATTREGVALHRLLLTSLEPALRTKNSLVVVPDTTTAGIPFAALRTPDGRWLLERNTITYAPSAGAFDRVQGIPGLPTRTLLAVADPAFDSTLLPRLGPLPGARAEGAYVSSLSSRGSKLVGREATVTRVLAGFRDAEIVHIASHAIADDRDARQSAIALAPDERSSGLLYSREIAGLHLENVKLVVLAGCHTAAANATNRTVRSIALAFVTAGAGTVVGTLWNIDDTAAVRVIRRFYDALQKDHSPPNALRMAQLHAIHTRVPVREWAAFQLHAGRKRGTASV